MPSAQRTRLTDDLWLAAHDGFQSARVIGDGPLGVGLAVGLLAELVHGKFLQLRDGELFRETKPVPDDPALRPLMDIMEAEERSWPPPVTPVRARAAVRARDDFDWPPHADDSPRWSSVEPKEQRHRQRGHDLTVWMSYLAYQRRAEERVVERLSRAGLVRRQERRRVFGGATVRYVPYDNNVTARPANMITSAARSRRDLSWQALLLTGLFLASGLHHHALMPLEPQERSWLADQLKRGLDDQSRELLHAADAAVGEAAMR